ncbi:terminase small subunit [Aneurinibacillus sp. Ricciae_BoGa-3]|uniref:terminase small subunit n=1 Tax=Aneurinibacillus sp. Ricciae_BoGa-3 TaxID=3022697 RepID=UPI0023404DDC|nr:terminase small subunit [Aneurinibacillus sp. Ricciae_BoGa-3]WCK53849.1 terminase small subunit [Aneurinibacillus sp. Ricciae_BoGa-3]
MAKWTDEQKQKALELAAAATIKQASEELGIPEGTIKRWRNETQSKRTEPQKNQPKPNRTKSEPNHDKSEPLDDSGLTPKQRLFVQEYLIDLNATQAATRAGYASDSAHVQGARLLTNDKVKLAIDVAQEARQKRTGITADRVVEQIAKIAFVDIRDIVTWEEGKIRIRPSDEIDGTVLAEISETISEGGAVSKKVKINDRMRALDMLAKHTGLLDSHRRKLEESKEKRATEKHALDMAKANVDQDTGDVVIVVDLEDDDDES